MLAIMDPTVQGVLYTIAIVLFVVGALLVFAQHRAATFALGLGLLGLGIVWFVAAWNAYSV